MSWRTIVISNSCKLSYKNNYLIIRSDKLQMIHLSEINVIVIDTPMVSITSYLINEISNNKIKLIFCNEKHNPSCEIMPLYGSHHTSKKVLNQSEWKNEIKEKVWKEVVKYKIYNQAMLLKKKNKDNYDMLLKYVDEVEIGDVTNREGHAAKVYFNSLFDSELIRHTGGNINSSLDYGYAILLSTFNKEIVSKGYITQLGINHKNEYNQYNLTCDLMEPYRILIDEIVYNNLEFVFDRDFKYKLIDVLNQKIKIEGKEQFVSNAIPIYLQSVFDTLEDDETSVVLNYEL